MTSVAIHQRAHVWLLDNGRDEADGIAATLGGDGLDDFVRLVAAQGFTAVSVKLLDGLTRTNVNLVKDLKAARKRVNDAGTPARLVVGGWAQLRTDPYEEATLADQVIRDEGADFWDPCGEAEYKWDGGNTSNPTDPAQPFNRSRIYVARFRELRPRLVVCFVSMPNEPSGGYIDWAPWVDRARGNARWSPECYPNEQPTSAAIWPDQAQRVAVARFRAEFVHPLLGVYPALRPTDASEYVASMRRAKTSGFSFGFKIYGAHTLPVEGWRTFSAAIKPAGDRTALAWYPT
jgi:hypothetical protein